MKKEIGRRLREVREQNGLSQTDFGKRLGIKYQHVSKYERGESVPTWENLIKLIEQFDVNINWLLKGTGDPYLSHERREPQDDVSQSSITVDQFSLEDYLKTDEQLKNALTDFVMKYKSAREAATLLSQKTEDLKDFK
ncbi:helix-turn-helix transcriptional regulator [candidate division KSB1 bacterium]|nr:helix-turn-helix transcriptional regulator [candidate division KSB1 bacterium]